MIPTQPFIYLSRNHIISYLSNTFLSTLDLASFISSRLGSMIDPSFLNGHVRQLICNFIFEFKLLLCLNQYVMSNISAICELNCYVYSLHIKSVQICAMIHMVHDTSSYKKIILNKFVMNYVEYYLLR